MATPQSQIKLQSQLASLEQQFTACSEHAARLFASLPAARLQQAPSTGGWSVAQCVEHLNHTSHQYLTAYEGAFAQLQPANSQVDYRPDLVGRMLTWYLEPPYRRRDKTLPAYEPAEQLDPAAVLASFTAGNRDICARLAAVNGTALDAVKVASSFNPKIRYNLYSMFLILAAHQRRHLWQAEQVKQRLQS
jgi:hypothetical protein